MVRRPLAALALVALVTGLLAGPVAANSIPKPPPPPPAVTVSSTLSDTSATVSASVNRILLLVRSCTYVLDTGAAASCGKPTSLKLISTGWTIKLSGLAYVRHTVTVTVRLWIGGTVSGSSSFGHKLLAIAWTNVDGVPGYQSGSGDNLMARLDDTNDDGVPSADDTVTANQYPLDLTGPFNRWGNYLRKTLVASGVQLADAPFLGVTVYTADGGIITFEDAYYEQGFSDEATAPSVSWNQFTDSLTGLGCDAIYTVQKPGILEADTFQSLFATSGDPSCNEDDAFLDVAIYP